MPTVLNIARRYVSAGVSAIPLEPQGKRPIVPWREFQSRRPTEDELAEWFDGTDYNIGIVTGELSGIDVVDCDSEEAVKLAKAKGLPSCSAVKTGRGFHFYFKHQKGTGKFQKNPDLPGIDLRAEGGFVVAPPSIHANGSQYQWTDHKKGEVPPPKSLADFPSLPKWVIKPSEPRAGTHPKSKADLYAPRGVGDRNQTLTRLTGMWARHLDLPHCLEMANTWNSLNTPPMDWPEVQRTVESIWQKEIKNHPERRQGREEMIFTPLGELLDEDEEAIEWLVADHLPTGGLSMLTAKPKVGKSTVARCLSLAVARGENFLNCETHKGPVFYCALEEKRSEVRKHFEAMGGTHEDEVFIFCGMSPEDGLAQLYEKAREVKPALIIIDPLFKMIRIKDGNDYSQVTAALEPVLMLARETGAHVLLVHHAGKEARSEGDSVLGSTALFGTPDTLLTMKRSDKYRTISSIQRYGTDLEEITLEFDGETRTLSAGVAKAEADQQSVLKLIEEYLATQKEPVEGKVIHEAVEGRKKTKVKALRQGIEDGTIKREGAGKKGDAYRYFAGSRSPLIYGEPETETENGAEEEQTREVLEI